MGDVQVEVAVALDVGQGHGGRTGVPQEPQVGLREAAGAVVAEGAGAAAQAVDQQVEVAVAVEVGQGAAGGILAGAADASPGRDVLEAPVSEVPVQGVVTLQAAEVQVHPAVAVHVAQGDAGTELQQAVARDGGLGEMVGEPDAGEAGGQEFEARTLARPGTDGRPPEPGLRSPLEATGRRVFGDRRHRTQQQAGQEGSGSAPTAGATRMVAWCATRRRR